jgi:hypothetical protein
MDSAAAPLRTMWPVSSTETYPLRGEFVSNLPATTTDSIIIDITRIAIPKIAFLCSKALEKEYNYRIYTVVTKNSDVESYSEFIILEPITSDTPVLDLNDINSAWEHHFRQLHKLDELDKIPRYIQHEPVKLSENKFDICLNREDSKAQ